MYSYTAKTRLPTIIVQYAHMGYQKFNIIGNISVKKQFTILQINVWLLVLNMEYIVSIFGKFLLNENKLRAGINESQKTRNKKQ